MKPDGHGSQGWFFGEEYSVSEVPKNSKSKRAGLVYLDLRCDVAYLSACLSATHCIVQAQKSQRMQQEIRSCTETTSWRAQSNQLGKEKNKS
mmetsp:Transcript_20611/g.28800  ORF Transcript_20611/g.28800 Transcript_20611/m.28800 type:complete len:92 (+) Transcript_20611:1264-1539(+)